MKNLILPALLIVSILSLNSCATIVNTPYQKITVESDHKDARIYINNQYKGDGYVVEKVRRKYDHVIKVEKFGFEEEYYQLENSFNMTWLPVGIITIPVIGGIVDLSNGSVKEFKDDFVKITLKQSDFYLQSSQTDLANKYYEQTVSEELTADEALKLINRIITSYFDNIETLDSKTGYVKTAWYAQSFNNVTVRTRVIVTNSGDEPLKYRIKLISEIAKGTNVSIKADQEFREWDRTLNKYSELINEFQTRLGN